MLITNIHSIPLINKITAHKVAEVDLEDISQHILKKNNKRQTVHPQSGNKTRGGENPPTTISIHKKAGNNNQCTETTLCTSLVKEFDRREQTLSTSS